MRYMLTNQLIKKILGFIAFFLFFQAINLAQDSCMTLVEIRSNLSRALIFADGRFLGDSAVTISLSKGKHQIKVRENLRSWNSQVFVDYVNFEVCNDSLTIDYLFKKRNFIDSTPQDVYIFEEGMQVGNTPLFIYGDRGKFQFIKNNYKTEEFDLAAADTPVNLKLDYSGYEKEKSFLETYWFEVLVGSAAILGAASAYLKIKADKNFEKYEETGDKNYLDKTHDLDLYAGIAFGALQINFGYLIYRFLNE